MCSRTAGSTWSGAVSHTYERSGLLDDHYGDGAILDTFQIDKGP